MKRKIFTGFVLFILSLSRVFAQQETDSQWWNRIHNWDGIRNWSAYIIKSPRYLGPNALPVPLVKDGLIGERTWFENTAEVYFSKHEQTQSLYSHLYIPIVKNKIAFEFYGRPVEHFKTDSIARDERFARDRSGEGYSVSDIYLSVVTQVLTEQGKRPDMTIDVALKTTAGKNLKNARNLNAPGYIFNATFGKTLYKSEGLIKKIRANAMLGVDIWQADLNEQNDAFLYGLRTDIVFNHWLISPSWAGYYGWIGNGDRPMVARFKASYTTKRTDYSLSYQYGFSDFIQNTIRAGITIYLNK